MSEDERAKSYATVLPDQTEETLLRFVAANELQQSEVIAWLDNTDLDVADDGVMRLLPTLYPKIRLMGLAHPETERIRGIYRHTLYRNRLIMHRGAQISATLRQQGIPSLLLKGAALLASPGIDLGTRPMADFDLLLSEETDLDTVERILCKSDLPGLDVRARSQGFLCLSDKNGLEYDLQYAPTPTRGTAGTIKIFWEKSHEVVYRNERFPVLCPEHFVFHTIVHGMKRNVVSPVRWIADLLQFNDVCSDLDWKIVAQTAVSFRLQDPTIAALEYLFRSGFLGPEVLPAVQTMHNSTEYAFDRRLIRNVKLPPETETRTQRLRRLFDEFSRQSVFEERRRTPIQFLQFLRKRTHGRPVLSGLKRFALDERD
ncbi:nucleotidyltransferase family protein [Pararhodobacter oceanensis]|uniref:nucleotidyltransferase family protein n=1 Tax=Pararhodobacter oceanensis TaxID=2172121 RepID=UPI003A93E7B7